MSRFAIRPATAADLPALAQIYQKARAFMAATGNPRQWGTTNPPRETLEEDIARGQLFVLCAGGPPPRSLCPGAGGRPHLRGH